MDPAGRYSALISAIGNNDFIWITIVLIVLLVFSAYFSATETAYTSCNKIRLKSIENNDPKKAKKAQKVLKQLDNYDRLLSTVLVGNNIVNIAASSIATVLFVAMLVGKEDLAPFISTLAMTVIVLIFGEVMPKTFAKDHPESFAMVFLPVTTFFEILFFPITWVLSLIKKIFKSKKEASVTEDELITIVEEAENEGEIDKHESELIRSAIEFDDVDVYDVMIPRVNVEAVPDDASMKEIAAIFQEKGYSRLPVYHETIDSVIGIIHIKDFYELYKDNKTDIRPIIQNSICVTRNMKISAALRILQKAKIHLAVVVDEFGGTEGIVTLEDIIEELVGEIYDEHDEVEVLFREQSDGAYIVDGAENLAEFFDLLGKNIDTGEAFESTSVGGFVTEQLKRIPKQGEEFMFDNLKFTVLKADSRKVLEVKVEVSETPEEKESEKS